MDEARITYGITAVTLLLLFIVIFFIIPKYVPADQQNDATHWAMVSYSALLFLINAIKTQLDVMNISMMVLFVLIIAVQTSGIYWWIPTYIPENARDETIHWMVIGSSMVILLVGILFTPIWKQSVTSTHLIGEIALGGRRRR